MELMNYERRPKKKSKAGLFGFVVFSCVGTASVFYLMKNEPAPKVLAQDLFVPVGSVSIYDEPEENPEVDIYSEEYLDKIEYKVGNDTHKTTKGNFKQNLSVPVIKINGAALDDVNTAILNKFMERYEAVKEQSASLENKFTYKVTYNTYESKIEGKRLLSFTFYERIIDDLAGRDMTYKLYGVTIDLATGKIITQEDVAPIILGNTYKTTIKEAVKSYAISKKLFTESTYTYTMTGLEEFYIKNGQLHVMFNPKELGENKDYRDIEIKN